jgi:hypothetical protein
MSLTHALAAFWQSLSLQDMPHPARWIGERAHGQPRAIWLDGHEFRPSPSGVLVIEPVQSPFGSRGHTDLAAHRTLKPPADETEIGPTTLDEWIARAAQTPAQLPTLTSMSIPVLQAQAQRTAVEFEARMHQARLHWTLGERLLGLEAHERRHVIQWHHRNRMVAVVCFAQRQVGITPLVTVAELREARRSAVPQSAADIPKSFERVSLAQLMWTTAQQSIELRLPPHHRQAVLSFKRHPEVPTRLLRERHLHLLEDLRQRSASLEELRARFPQWANTLEHDLASLLLAGALTNQDHEQSRWRKWWAPQPS